MRLEPVRLRMCTANRSAVHRFSPASRSRASAAAAARAAHQTLGHRLHFARQRRKTGSIPKHSAPLRCLRRPVRKWRMRSATRLIGRNRNQRTINKVTITMKTTNATTRQKLRCQRSSPSAADVTCIHHDCHGPAQLAPVVDRKRFFQPLPFARMSECIHFDSALH